MLYFASQNGWSQLAPLNNQHYTKIISSVTGDLNKDGILDQVVVKEDTMAFTDPYQLEVYFGQENVISNGSFPLLKLSSLPIRMVKMA